MLILGVDPGITVTGAGVVRGGGRDFEMVWHGSVATGSREPMPDRLLRIHDFLSNVTATYEPDVLAIERIFHHVNPKSSLVLGHARGVAVLVGAQAGIPVMEYTPSEVKRALTGLGGASKDRVREMVATLLGIRTPFRTTDESDALAVAVCCLGRISGRPAGKKS